MDNKTKKIITEKWLRAFPDLSAFAQNKLYKIIGPFICGIELINLPRSENYRPHFVIYPLYKKDIKSCLEYPALMFEFYNNKKLQLNLPYDDVNGKFIEAQNIVFNDLKISLKNNVKLNCFYEQITDTLMNSNTYSYMSHTRKYILLYELKFYVALYVGCEVELNSIVNQIQQLSKDWDMQVLEKLRGKFDLWVQSLHITISDRDDFLKQIETNKQDKKVSRLRSSELIA